jgi:hypothetical protein
MVLGVGLLLVAVLVDSSDLALVLSGVVLVCAGGLTSVLASPSLSVVDGHRRDDRTPGVV